MEPSLVLQKMWEEKFKTNAALQEKLCAWRLLYDVLTSLTFHKENQSKIQDALQMEL